MRISQRTQKVAVGIYTLFFGALVFTTPTPGSVHSLLFAAATMAPGVLFLMGVVSCRFVVGGFSAIFLLFWSLLPLMQHAIDRHARFWIFWAVGETILTLSMLGAFLRPREQQDQVEAGGMSSSKKMLLVVSPIACVLFALIVAVAILYRSQTGYEALRDNMRQIQEAERPQAIEPSQVTNTTAVNTNSTSPRP